MTKVKVYVYRRRQQRQQQRRRVYVNNSADFCHGKLKTQKDTIKKNNHHQQPYLRPSPTFKAKGTQIASSECKNTFVHKQMELDKIKPIKSSLDPYNNNTITMQSFATIQSTNVQRSDMSISCHWVVTTHLTWSFILFSNLFSYDIIIPNVPYTDCSIILCLILDLILNARDIMIKHVLYHHMLFAWRGTVLSSS